MKTSTMSHGEVLFPKSLRNVFFGALMSGVIASGPASANLQGCLESTKTSSQASEQVSNGTNENHIYHRIESFEGYSNLYDNSDSLPQIERLLVKSGGIYFGDDHTDHNAAFFMTEQMPFFKQNGVTHLFVELGYQDQRELFERFNAGYEGAERELYEALEPRWRKYGAFASRMQMLVAARDHGVLVLPIDVANRAEFPTTRELHDKWAAPIIEQDLGNNKYLVFGGDIHGSSFKNEGVSQILDIGHVRFNSKQGVRYLNVSFEPDTDILPRENAYNSGAYILAHSVHPQHIVNTLLTKYGYLEELELANDLICEIDNMVSIGASEERVEDVMRQLAEVMEAQNYGNIRRLHTKSVLSALPELVTEDIIASLE